MSLLPRLIPGAIALALCAAPAFATTWTLSITQDGLGDSGPDWFGTVVTEGTTVSAIDITVAGTRYNINDANFFFKLTYRAPEVVFPGDMLQGVAFHELTTEPTTVLQFWNFSYLTPDGYDLHRKVSLSPCQRGGACGGGPVFGSYDLTEVVAPVPLPAAGGLAMAGLGGLALLRRRR